MVRRPGWLMAAVMIGCLWGTAEVLMDASFAWRGSPARAIVLPTVAVLFLGMLHGLESKPGTVLAAGAVAAFFKFLNVPFFACQIFALLLLALLLEGVLSAMRPRLRVPKSAKPLLVGLAVWGFFLAFALTMTFLVRYRWWAMGGLSKVASYVFLQGVPAAVLSVGTFSLGYKAGYALWQKWNRLLVLRPSYCYAMLAALVAAATAVSLGL